MYADPIGEGDARNRHQSGYQWQTADDHARSIADTYLLYLRKQQRGTL